uniref:Uncharacterized protein n=1 Tax=Vespula pensylvanica TaxID=30213 RepID=A0A834N1D0_VESPE|nr:hypothetical protein H0235_017254 [Vespula pensylvanica]
MRKPLDSDSFERIIDSSLDEREIGLEKTMEVEKIIVVVVIVIVIVIVIVLVLVVVVVVVVVVDHANAPRTLLLRHFEPYIIRIDIRTHRDKGDITETQQ